MAKLPLTWCNGILPDIIPETVRTRSADGLYSFPMTQTLNIPIKIMKRFCGDKSLWEVFVFAVCVKMCRKDSRIPADIKSVRKLMGCSYYKAERMIEAARQCPELFYVYKNGRHIVARSFTHGRLEKRIHHTKKNEYIAYCASCFRFGYDDSEPVRHIKVSRTLRDKLITDAIMATQQADGSNPITHSIRPSDSRPITLHSLSKASGYHYTTVLKHIQKMEKAKKVDSVQGGLVAIKRLANNDGEQDTVLTDDPALLNRKVWYDWDGFRFVREPNRYAVVRADRDDYSVNVIFNHKRRHRKHVSTKPRQQENENQAGFLNRTTLGHLWL